ncbi:MAG: hypothetical protein SPI77_02170 [Corynebacterium sp.]|nr:hypothetical protein [Corynebacterium sp.]
MAEKQLTVAELLARVKEEGGSSAPASSRRRHRSLEEGGVSVAELTGSIPRVNERPEVSRHGGELPPVHIVREGEKAPLVTGSFKAITPEQLADAPAPAPADAPAPAPAAPEVDVEAPAPAAPEVEVEAPAPAAKPSIASIVITAVIGVVLGGILFKVFELLWASALMPLLVILLAVIVTALVGAGVYALRPNRDGLTTGLAVFTALILTFGPVLVTGL